MKYNYSYVVREQSKEDKEHFENAYEGYKPTGYILEKSWMEEQGRDGGSSSLVIYKAVGKRNNWTPYGMCRDCGDHYIIANWSSYDRIDKATMTAVHDVEDR